MLDLSSRPSAIDDAPAATPPADRDVGAAPPVPEKAAAAEIDRSAGASRAAPAKPAIADTGYDPFADQPSRRPRRNPNKRWTAAAVVAGASMLLGTAAIVYSGAPGLAAQLGLGLAEAETPLRFIDKNVERRMLPSGKELFAVSGKVVNPSAEPQHVPDVRVELRDGNGRIVHGWRITPEARTLGPEEAIEFNSATLDVPDDARMLELSFAGELGG